MRSKILGLIGLVLLSGSIGARADVVFVDSTFNLADYSASAKYASEPGATLAYSSSSNTLQFTSTFSCAGPCGVAQGLINTTFAYNPLVQGAIASIDSSVNKNLTLNYVVTVLSSFRPMIEQDGVLYLAEIDAAGLFTGPGSTGFNVLSQAGLLATDFFAFDFTTGLFSSAHPNFAGDAMLFGIAQIGSNLGGTPGAQALIQYQDLTFDIHGAPEPTSLALLALGLAGLGFSRRKQ